MYVPIMQNLLLHAFNLASDEDIRRDRVYAAFFAKIMMPKLQKCSSTVAALVRENVFVADTVRPMASGFGRVKAGIEEVYDCIGLTCKEVGGIVNAKADSLSLYIRGAEPC